VTQGGVVARVSIIIPTNRSPEVLEPCLRSIAGQRCDLRDVEVIVVFNGMAPGMGCPIGKWPFRLLTASVDEANIGAAKNAALDRARGDLILLINDDVRLESGFVAAHLASHQCLGKPAMVLGLARWQRYADETVFDRLIQTTSMIFFYDRMEPHRWYSFRHAWNLNLSVPRRYCESVRFDVMLKPVNFDDVEWAFRLEHVHGLRVWFEPAAGALHDHRYTLDGYLTREGHLGRMATLLWQCNPDCFRAIYASDLDDGYVEHCRELVQREEPRQAELLTSFRAVVERPPASLTPDGGLPADLIRVLYHAHLPLKRLAFRRGLLNAVEARAPREDRHAAPCL
jgi:glycosyltransferase involved in cell wall biosynthesis